MPMSKNSSGVPIFVSEDTIIWAQHLEQNAARAFLHLEDGWIIPQSLPNLPLRHKNNQNESCYFCSHVGCLNLKLNSRYERKTCHAGQCCRQEYCFEYEDYRPVKEVEAAVKVQNANNKKMGKKAVAKSNDKELKPVKVMKADPKSGKQQLQKARYKTEGLWVPKKRNERQWQSVDELAKFISPVEEVRSLERPDRKCKPQYAALVLQYYTPYKDLLEFMNKTVQAETGLSNPTLHSNGSKIYNVEKGPASKVEFLRKVE